MLAPSKRTTAAGESINILWLEHEDVFILLRMSNDSIWKPKIHRSKLRSSYFCSVSSHIIGTVTFGNA